MGEAADSFASFSVSASGEKQAYWAIERADNGERAVLVGVNISARPAARRPSAESARAAALIQAENFNETDTQSSRPLSSGESIDFDTGLTPDASLAEFRELVESAGASVVAQLIQRRSRPDPATLIGAGKVEEITGIVAANNADLVIFDRDLSPTQLRNLENLLPCRVLDRTQLILDIFARHARTREGQLQVELAQLEYMLPRLTGRGKAMSQLGGGIGTRGPGETQLETDRRRIQRRLVHLREELEKVRRIRRQQRQRREAVPVPTVALVGYTNAGKSTLFNRLTGAGVLASSRMFATLDPKLRTLELPSRRKILLSDTVGFIRNLPHTLVTSFRATLEEVERAEVLLHIRDASSTYAEEQKLQVEKVLGELEVLDKPRIEVMNKIDLLPAEEQEALAVRGRIQVSARTGEGLEALLRTIDEALVADPLVDADLIVPQSAGAALAAIEAGMIIHQRAFEGDRVHLSVRGPASLVGRIRQGIAKLDVH
ncbi:GTPase HflX [Acidicapsa dinghuensis]|uniref:GTPase HflX n=1 Tax=Acidicapsa dinghuensis TaxID=2218256 RepID=A0ABW1EGD4_9BACT|nr:GTPase HflX [Acidicapsa dinghuensis]